MTEMVEARDVRVGDVLVLGEGEELSVLSRAGDEQFTFIGYEMVNDSLVREFFVPSNALLSVKRKPRKWRRTVVLETTDGQRAEEWRKGFSSLATATTTVAVVSDFVEEVVE